MAVTTVNISFQTELLDKIDEAAASEDRSRSELLREAARSYIQRKNRWDKLFAYGDKAAAAANISPSDIAAEIASYRASK